MTETDQFQFIIAMLDDTASSYVGIIYKKEPSRNLEVPYKLRSYDSGIVFT